MLRSNVFNLASREMHNFERAHLESRDIYSRKTWKMVLLASLRDRVDEVWLRKREGRVEFWYKKDGEFYSLVSTQEDLFSSLMEEIRDLTRPRGFRVWLIRRLRALIHWLEGPLNPDYNF